MSVSSLVPSSSDLANVDSDLPSIQVPTEFGKDASIFSTANPKTTNPSLYSPVSGVVGYCFIRMCLWVDLLVSWKRRAYVAPEDGFPNFAASEAAAAKSALVVVSR
jgi:hypothetical protein